MSQTDILAITKMSLELRSMCDRVGEVRYVRIIAMAMGLLEAIQICEETDKSEPAP
jgi:hypothetical protein